MTPAERLRAAADRIEGLAKEATEGPWDSWNGFSAGGGVYVTSTADGPGGYTFGILPGVGGDEGWRRAEADAAWIATMSPVIAGPLVEWLIAIHDDIVRYGYDEAVSYQAEALELADAILRGSTT